MFDVQGNAIAINKYRIQEERLWWSLLLCYTDGTGVATGEVTTHNRLDRV